MNILIANVGNIRVNEIKCLAEALNKKHNVTIAAMAIGSSSMGQAFSSGNNPVRVSPLLYKEVVKNTHWIAVKDVKELTPSTKTKTGAFDNIAAFEFYTSPADAISIMLGELMLTKRPDLVICGINNGVHFGQDIYSSSNIGMAMEAGFFRVPAVAIGVERQIGGHSEAQLAPAVKFIEKNIEAISKLKLSNHTFLNINIPPVEKYTDFAGVKITRMGKLAQLSEYDERTDVKGNKYYWAKDTTRSNADLGDESGRTWFDKGYISITPLSYDATDYKSVEDWNNGIIKKMKQELDTKETWDFTKSFKPKEEKEEEEQ